jgi:hypothetical protein
MKVRLLALAILAPSALAGGAHAQGVAKKTILVDIAHGQRFWHDPARMEGRPQQDIDRARYMTDQLTQTAAALGARIRYVADPLTPARLHEGDVLFIHIPAKSYGKDEVNAIGEYVKGGGSLLIVMDEDYWSTLQDTNVNDITRLFGIEYDGLIPGEQSGGHTRAGLLTPERLKIPYHGGRVVSGGTPFCFTDESEDRAFGVFVDVKGGGRVIAMGDGMVSLYMTRWEGVSDYQCQEFMRAALGWLLG